MSYYKHIVEHIAGKMNVGRQVVTEGKSELS